MEDESEAQELVLRALIRKKTDALTFLIRDASSEVAQLVKGNGFYVTQDCADAKAIVVDDLERSKSTGYLHIRGESLKNLLKTFNESQNLELDWYLERDLGGNLKYELQGAYSILNPERLARV